MRVVIATIVCAVVAAACVPAGPSAVGSPTTTVPAPATQKTTSAPVATASAAASPTRSPALPGSRIPAPVPSFGQSDLVVRVDLQTDIPGRFTTVVVASDGSYVTAPADWIADRYVRRLTPEGVALVRDRIAATRLFSGADGSYGLTLKPGAQPPGHGTSGLVVSFWNGARVVHVSTTLLIAGDERYYDMTPEGTTLAALAQALRAPEAWLPPVAWRDAVPQQYVARYYRVVTGGVPGGPDAPFDLSFVAWPFATPLTSFGDVVVSSGQLAVAGPQLWLVDGPVRCAVLGRDDALPIRDALSAARAPIWTYANDGFAVQGIVDGRSVALIAQPMLPATSCGQDLL